MARRKYRPYPTRRQQKSRRMRNLALVLIVLIAGVIILIQVNKNKPDTPDTTIDEGIREVTLDDNTPNAPAVSEPPEETTPPEIAEPAPEPIATQPPQPEETTPEPVATEPDTIPAEITNTIDNQVSPQARELINQAIELSDEQGKLIPARDLLNAALDLNLTPSVRDAVKKRLTKMADTWLFGSEVYAEDKLTGYYTVPKGDNFENIAKLHKVPYDILLKINGILRPEMLRAGQKIKVIHGPFNVKVYKSTFTMDLYLQNKYVKTYKVGLGTKQHETPTGLWRVKSDGKLDNKPSWTDPDTGRTYDGTDPDYPLGSRWIAIEGLDENTKDRTGFAIHGTKDPDSIGTQSSRGCIRLYNGNVIEIYDLLYGGVSQVLVMD